MLQDRSPEFRDLAAFAALPSDMGGPPAPSREERARHLCDRAISFSAEQADDAHDDFVAGSIMIVAPHPGRRPITWTSAAMRLERLATQLGI